ncbi:hypothetical protein H696_04123 [Fonticula alba]|uniref:Uncharacterized protein n=1 Tax=Fonticula alba TaxID=691883 RepID=A0A058Z6G4_FONAL|nr:hypothetical protein H696_04123 [Fonticula alba]KCV69716.1 hypothetical protein H696_04123 [Fonticula alba]|eukprot:XP_009496281.1 hypothetical protein H696_04123 [Fonticula alba]
MLTHVWWALPAAGLSSSQIAAFARARSRAFQCLHRLMVQNGASSQCSNGQWRIEHCGPRAMAPISLGHFILCLFGWCARGGLSEADRLQALARRGIHPSYAEPLALVLRCMRDIERQRSYTTPADADLEVPSPPGPPLAEEDLHLGLFLFDSLLVFAPPQLSDFAPPPENDCFIASAFERFSRSLTSPIEASGSFNQIFFRVGAFHRRHSRRPMAQHVFFPTNPNAQGTLNLFTGASDNNRIVQYIRNSSNWKRLSQIFGDQFMVFLFATPIIISPMWDPQATGDRGSRGRCPSAGTTPTPAHLATHPRHLLPTMEPEARAVHYVQLSGVALKDVVCWTCFQHKVPHGPTRQVLIAPCRHHVGASVGRRFSQAPPGQRRPRPAPESAASPADAEPAAASSAGRRKRRRAFSRQSLLPAGPSAPKSKPRLSYTVSPSPSGDTHSLVIGPSDLLYNLKTSLPRPGPSAPALTDRAAFHLTCYQARPLLLFPHSTPLERHFPRTWRGPASRAPSPEGTLLPKKFQYSGAFPLCHELTCLHVDLRLLARSILQPDWQAPPCAGHSRTALNQLPPHITGPQVEALALGLRKFRAAFRRLALPAMRGPHRFRRPPLEWIRARYCPRDKRSAALSPRARLRGTARATNVSASERNAQRTLESFSQFITPTTSVIRYILTILSLTLPPELIGVPSLPNPPTPEQAADPRFRNWLSLRMLVIRLVRLRRYEHLTQVDFQTLFKVRHCVSPLPVEVAA